MARDSYLPRPCSDVPTTPFDSVEEAWFWFMQANEARQAGAKILAGLSATPRPCEPLDMIRVVDRLYRNRRLMMDHLRVLAHYGRRLMAPDPARAHEARASQLWREALGRIEPVLRGKGIVA